MRPVFLLFATPFRILFRQAQHRSLHLFDVRSRGPAQWVAIAGQGGVNGMVMSMALDLADKGVRVNAICLALLGPLIEVAKAEADRRQRCAPNGSCIIPRPGKLEMGELSVYLASDLSAFMTGQAIAIDGGYSIGELQCLEQKIGRRRIAHYLVDPAQCLSRACPGFQIAFAIS
jgi:2-keto-3-deoxy-L-fuconate dehydrogenase